MASRASVTAARFFSSLLEAMFDRRADTFCLVTSDSDFAYLCRKLRERGAQVVIVGEAKSPAALRNASDQFFEWARPVPPGNGSALVSPATEMPAADVTAAAKPELPKPVPKRRPRFVAEAVELMAADTSDGKVHFGALGQYLKRTDPAFSPKIYGFSGLLEMVRTYDLLIVQQEPGGHWTVRLKPKLDAEEAPG